MSQSLFSPSRAATVQVVRDEVLSAALGRTVRLDVVLPPAFDPASHGPYPVLYLNDGQDLRRLRLKATLDALYQQQELWPFVLIAIHAGNRMQEYGTAGRPDYLGRGSKAQLYTDFVLQELLPYVQQKYHASADPEQAVFAGFSLGGLSAFDIVWRNPDAFTRAGAFSGSFWWRRKAFEDGYIDADRIMHSLVRSGRSHPSHRFWLQTGTLDETNDRNQNGIIDSIEDTLDLLAELVRQGVPDQHIRYVEVAGGHHDQQTWGRIMPDFLRWAFGKATPAPNAAWQPAGALPSKRNWGSTQRLGRRRQTFKNTPQATEASVVVPTETAIIVQPISGEYPAYYENYLRHVPAETDPIDLLVAQGEHVRAMLGALTDEQAMLAYAPEKWTIKEVLVHILDSERIFAYRALCVARGDQQSLPGFDENAYAPASEANARPISDILAEHAAVRQSTVALFRSFAPHILDRVGLANDHPISVRALVHVVPGHEAHHLMILHERYFPLL
ncbi:alpha/beta hydrolase-fold protein [Hymenobacter sp. HD11105]